MVDLDEKVQGMEGSLRETVAGILKATAKVYRLPKERAQRQEKRGRPSTNSKQDEEETLKKRWKIMEVKEVYD